MGSMRKRKNKTGKHGEIKLRAPLAHPLDLVPPVIRVMVVPCYFAPDPACQAD